MFSFVLKKIKNRKTLNACLAAGVALLIAVLSQTCVFEAGGKNTMLQTDFRNQLISENEYPFVLSRANSSKEPVSYEEIRSEADSFYTYWDDSLKISSLEHFTHIWIPMGYVNHDQVYNSEWMDIGCIPGMEEHVEVLAGSYPDADATKDADDIYPCVISEKSLDYAFSFVGDVMDFYTLTDANGKTLKLRVVGVVREKDEDSYFWQVPLNDFDRQVYLGESIMSEIQSRFNRPDITYEIYDLVDYSKVNIDNAEDIHEFVTSCVASDSLFNENVSGLLESFFANASFVSVMCLVLEFPILILLLAFICMVIGQIIGMEKGEISILTSRGFSRLKIVRIYLNQALVIGFYGYLTGIPLGYIFANFSALSTGFLRFSFADFKIYAPRISMLAYGLIGFVIFVFLVALIVFFNAGQTISERKSSKKLTSLLGKIWFIIPLLLLGMSIYLLINYRKQSSLITEKVLSGENPDPMIFMNTTIFLIALGLLSILIIKYIVKGIYTLGKKHWKPDAYASFLQITRADARSSYITVFLVLTIAMGVVNASTAATINNGYSERIAYNVGSDIVIKEDWEVKMYREPVRRINIRYYTEPDFDRFTKIIPSDEAELTRVLRDENARAKSGSKTLTDVTMLGINTKEYGETGNLLSGVNDTHWYNYLNELALHEDGALISEELAAELNLSVGDSFYLTRINPFLSAPEDTIDYEVKVCGIYHAMPTLVGLSVITNYPYTVGGTGDFPYEIWIKFKNNKSVDSATIKARLEEAGIRLASFTSTKDEIQKNHDSTLVKITNGIFTMGFLVSLILCVMGYLIYWISSVKERSLLFGIYRAMGMSYGEVRKMLVLEQLLSTVSAGILGIASGLLASFLYITVTSLVYLPEAHPYAISIVISASDLIIITILIAIMILACLQVMNRQIRKLNIINAIKMGED